jgi:hypothetical protein
MTAKRYKLLRDVVIPAGTILDRAPRRMVDSLYIDCVVGLGKDATASLSLPESVVRDAEDWIAEIDG